MLSKIFCGLFIAAVAASCASANKNSRLPNSENSLNSKVNLVDVVSLNSGYWDVKKGNDTYYGRYKAFILATEGDYYSLRVYAEKDGLDKAPNLDVNGKKPQNIPEKNDDSKYVQLVDNNSFVWGSDWAGTEPSLSINGRGSLVVVTGNSGIGRTSWEQKVTIKLNPVTDALEVIGFDYNYYDKLDLSNGSCSYNFNTGKGVIVRNGPEYDSANDKPIAKPTVKKSEVRVPAAKINLADWKDSSEMPVLSACMKDL
jgi:hypothetical protein